MRYFKFALGLILIFILAAGFIHAAAPAYVEVIYVSGRAEYLLSSAADWQGLKAGVVLRSGDSVKTYKDSFADLSFDRRRKNIVSVKSSSHVVLKLGDPEKIELVDGELFALVKTLPRGSRFEVRTPTAVCGARGTGWAANANQDRAIVSAFEKDSYAKGIDKNGNIMEDNMTVKEGFQTEVRRFQKPSKLEKISQNYYNKWNKWKDDLIKRLGAANKVKERLSRDLEKIQDQRERVERRRDRDRIDKRTKSSGAGTSTTRDTDGHSSSGT